MQEEVLRHLSLLEKAIIEKLLEADFAGRDELVEQLRGMQVRQVDSGGSLNLQPATENRTSQTHGVVAEARYPDLDTNGEAGPHVNVLLHVVHGKLSMLEIFKDDSSRILKQPNPSEFQRF